MTSSDMGRFVPCAAAFGNGWGARGEGRGEGRLLPPSWRGLARPSAKTFRPDASAFVDTRPKAGHDALKQRACGAVRPLAPRSGERARVRGSANVQTLALPLIRPSATFSPQERGEG